MDAAAEAIAARVRDGGLLAPGEPVVVMLSGGRDSVCLLDLAALIAGRGAVSGLHVHHGLRGKDADADVAHCERLASELGVRLDVEHVRPASEAPGNIQAWARDARYEAGTRAATARGARLAAGHTATDQVETILYRLAASPGRRALLGMADERGLLVRPLLRAGITREETAQWCGARGLAWREDAMNLDDRFARVRVRERLVPALRAVHPAADGNVLRTAALLREEADVLELVVNQALSGRDHIAVEHLASLPRALARLVVRRLAEDATGSLCARAPGRLDDVLALGASGAVDVGDGARAVVDRGMLRFVCTPPLQG